MDTRSHVAVDRSHGTDLVLRGGQNVHVAHGGWSMGSGTRLQLRRVQSRARLSDGSADNSSPRGPGRSSAHQGQGSGCGGVGPAQPGCSHLCQEERFNVSGGWGETVVSEAPGYQSDGVCPSPGDCIGTGSVSTSGGVTSSSCSSCYPQGGCLSTCTYAANWIQSGTCPGSSSGTLGGYPPASATYETSHVLAICRE